MNPEAARALFDRALDDELDPETRAAFESALQADAGLRAEFARLEAVQQATAALARPSAPVDLLGGVQQKLRARSGGKFYRDRFAEQGGRSQAIIWTLVAASLVVLIVAVWFSLNAL